jgi:hypothetical protein
MQNQKPFPVNKKKRIVFLNSKINDGSISDFEHQELLSLIEENEKWAAERMMNIAKLSDVINTGK